LSPTTASRSCSISSQARTAGDLEAFASGRSLQDFARRKEYLDGER